MSLLNLIITFIKTFPCKQSKKLPMFRLLQDTSESEISNYCQLFHSLDRPFGPWPFVDSRKGSRTLKLCNTIQELAPKISHCVMSFELLKKEVVNWSENFLLDWGCDYYDSKFFRSVRKFVMVSVVQVTGYGHLQGLIGAKSKHQFLFFRTLALHIALSVLANILGVLWQKSYTAGRKSEK